MNWYLVEDGDRITIVDTGHPVSWRSLHRALAELHRHPAQIDAIVLTHGHFDHMGFAERAHRAFGIPVYAPTGERSIVAHPWDYEHEHSRLRQAIEHPSFIKVFGAMSVAGAPMVKGCRDAAPYRAGERLDVPGRPRAIPTPGHTPAHCALELSDRGVLLAGDAIVTFNPYTGGHGPQIVSGAATADSARALQSLTAIEACDADTLATGHGPVWRGEPKTAVAMAREVGPT